MAPKIDSSKLLPSVGSSSPSSSISSALVVYKKPNLAASIKPIEFKTGSAIIKRTKKDEKKDAEDINNKLALIQKVFKSELIVSKKKAEAKREDKEKTDFEEAEKKLESPKTKGLGLQSIPISIPNLGFMDRVNRFLFFTAAGWLLPKILDFLPKLEEFAKKFKDVAKFAGDMFEKLHGGFKILVKFGGDLKDKTIGFIKQIPGGEDFVKKLSGLDKQFNAFVDAAIVASILAGDIGLDLSKQLKKSGPGKPITTSLPEGQVKPGTAAGRYSYDAKRALVRKKYGDSAARIYDNEIRNGRSPLQALKNIERRYIGKGKIVAERMTGSLGGTLRGSTVIKGGVGRTARRGAIRAVGKANFKALAGPFAKLRGPLSHFLGNVAAPGVSAVIGEMDARQRFSSGDNVGGWMARISAILDTFAAAVGVAGIVTSALALTGVGAAVPAALVTAAGVAKTLSIGISGILFIRDLVKIFFPKVPMFSKGGRIVRKYQGGGTTRGGVSTNKPITRTVRLKKPRPQKIRPSKSKPGKDVGGESKIKKLYPDPKVTGVMPLNEWLATDSAGTYQQYVDRAKDSAKKAKANPYKVLTTASEKFKELPMGLGNIIGAAVDSSLGERVDVKRAVKQFSSGLNYLFENYINQKSNSVTAAFARDMNSFAEGGVVPYSEQSGGVKNSMNFGEMISKILEPAITSKINSILDTIKKEVQKKGVGSGSDEGAGGDGGAGDTGDGVSVKSIDITGFSSEDIDALGRMIQAESGGESDLGKAAVMNVILNRYRLARAGKGYIPRGKTKDNVTIRDILYAPSQFSPISDGRFARTSSASGKSALAKAISSGGNDPQKFKEKLMAAGLNEDDANYVVVSSSFSNPSFRNSRPFNTREVRVGNHVFQESPNARLLSPGQKFEARVVLESPGEINSRILRAAKELKGMDTTSGPGGGNVSCVWAVNKVFARAGVATPWGSAQSTDQVISGLDRNKWRRVSTRDARPGDVWVYDANDGRRGHVGIMMDNGKVLSNSSHQGRFAWEATPSELLSRYPANGLTPAGGAFYRAPGSSTATQLSPSQTQQRLRPTARLIDIQNQVTNMTERAPVIVPGVGRVILKRNQSGTLIKEYYDKNNKKLKDADEFFRLIDPSWGQLRQSTAQAILPQSQTEGSVAQSLMPSSETSFTGGSVAQSLMPPSTSDSTSIQAAFRGGPIARSQSKLPIPNSYASYENSYGNGESMIAIQPIIIRQTIPMSSRSRDDVIMFPVPVPVNSSSGTEYNRSRGY